MRIGLDVGKALAPRDGIGRYTHELLRALIAADSGDRFVLFGLPPDLAEHEVHRRLGTAATNRVSTTSDERSSIDVFHATAWKTPASFRGPVAFTCYDLTFLTHPKSHTLNNKIHCLDGLLRAHLAGAAFIAISQAGAEDLRRHLCLSDDQVHVIYPAASSGLRPIDSDIARHHLRQRFAVDGEPVLAVGTLEPRKNLERLVDAFLGLQANLRQAHPLVIVGGGGWKNETLLARCREQEEVHLLGPVGEDDLAPLYSSAAILAYPSLAEGFGLPILEAMVCGAPVITSDRSALPEVAGDAARLVDPYDTASIHRALDELLRDPAARQRLRRLGHIRAADFSWGRAARQTLDLYRQLAPA